MKKLIILFIFLLIAAGLAGGTGFYFGWVKIEPETFGLAHSTITGTVDLPLESGNLYWFWQKLIPKTFYIYTIQREPYSIEFETSTSLPRSENLTDFGEFNLKMNVKLQYTIDFESAKGLFEEGLLNNFHNIYRDEIISLANETTSTFILEGMARYAYSTRTFDYTVLENIKDELEDNIVRHSKVYNLKYIAVSIIFIEIPQIEIYVEALKKYFSYLENLYSLKEVNYKKELEYKKKQRDEDYEFERLKKYGELISQYPELLKYFYIEKFGEKAEVIVMPQDEKTGFPRMLEYETEGKRKPFIPEDAEMDIAEKPEEDTEELAEEKEQEITSEEDLKDKWYESLKFWNFFKKEENG